MDPLFCTEITKFKGEKKIVCDDTLVREVKLEIFINDDKVGALMATPVDQKALSIGYLMSEGVVEDIKDISKIEISQDGTEIYVNAKINQNNLDKLNTQSVIISGCGRSNTAWFNSMAIDIKFIHNDIKFDKNLILKQMSKFYTQCDLYEQTGCVHTAKLYVDDKTFFIGEDIAQHNTIDKAVGKARLAGIDLSKTFLMVSGRLSSEMVAKAVMHQIPLQVSRTAPTSLGVRIARKFNLTLCGFARGENMNVYSGENRINA